MVKKFPEIPIDNRDERDKIIVMETEKLTGAVQIFAKYVGGSGTIGQNGWAQFWAMTVEEADLSKHCMKCFDGYRDKAISMKTATNEPIGMIHVPGTLLYLCGVSQGFKWANNFHLACEVTGKPEDRVEVDLYNGHKFEAVGVKRIEIEAGHAAGMFPAAGDKFLSCRNFQFAAQMVNAGKIVCKKPKKLEPSLFSEK